ncbi:MAG: glutamate synthase large subunit, partial [Planctomycetes bacterium]|nr:glutamate synthase large subunit [Planctomycetota bacterium]
MRDDGPERPYPLHDPESERDSCGIGFVARIDGTPEHAVVARAVESVTHLTHRGAIGGDRDTGDGAGILVRIPDAFFRGECAFDLPPGGRYGVGMLFLPQGAEARRSAEGAIEQAAERSGLRILGWRDVPVASECLGAQARRTQPVIRQVFIGGGDLEGDAFERRLYVLRRRAERAAADAIEGEDPAVFYIPSLSSRMLTYKGLLTASQLEAFYPDLADEGFASPFAIFHQRFSTNTFPTWELAQPFRYIAHNGEINTLRGNVNRMKAREAHMRSSLLEDDLFDLFPVIQRGGSDSAVFDNVLELLVQAGRSIPHVMMMMIPEAFGPKYHISADKRAFYEYHAALMEPWDGPAAMVFTDGTLIGGTLDRNGLRPCRYTITKDGYAILASETGVLDLPPEMIAAKGRLQPGRMFLVNLAEGRIVGDTEIKARISRRQPYRKWLAQNQATLRGLFGPPAPVEPDRETLLERQRIFGYSAEEIAMLIQPMAVAGQEAVGSMGTDTPPAVLSDRPLLMFDYFKQLFAQVTNPPIDPLRESLVMSLMSFMGRERNLLDETPEHARQLKLPHPILSNDDMSALRAVDGHGLRSITLPVLFDVEKGGKGLELALDEIFWEASRAIAAGTSLIVLSDKGADARRAPIPSLLATAGLHHHLIRERKRTLAGIIVETGEAREVMHFALLVGYGATAVNPYLAFETVAALVRDGRLPGALKVEDAIDNTIQAIKKGLLKTFSRMGISTIRSYRGAQIFEAIGLHRDLIDRYFTGTASRIGGIGMAEVAEEVRRRHAAALRPAPGAGPLLALGGQYRVRRREGEHHHWNHRTVTALQAAVRGDRRDLYREFARLIDDQGRKLGTIRGLFRFRPQAPVPIEEVEPVDEIVRRFVTGAMSFGSISREAHESIATAMNRLGAMSNTGEGGEDPARLVPLPNGDSTSSAVKQVASGRFGVTIEYLASGRDIQIKIAQGAKPGEGGQLPGHKVDAIIARVRHSTPGVTLISPPPHHDIYSIEDLAQLIFD